MSAAERASIIDAIGGVPVSVAGNAVEVTDIHKSFGRHEVLKGVSLTVKPREVVVVCGPSGSGKTTLIRCINHLEKIQSGRIMVNGHLIGYREVGGRLVSDKERNIARQRQEIGMVFQRFNLFPHKTALGNIVEAPIQVGGIARDEALAMGRQLLARVGLAHKEDAYPAQLSGGQQQRVAIARALAMRPAAAGARRPCPQGGRLPGAVVGRSAAARRDRSSAGIEVVRHDASVWNAQPRASCDQSGIESGSTRCESLPSPSACIVSLGSPR